MNTCTLQAWFGYSLAGDTSQQKILFLEGPRGCGKGTIARILTAMLGDDSVCTSTLASMASNFGLQSFLNKRLAIFADVRLSK